MSNNAGTYLLVDPAFSLEAFHGVAYSMLLHQVAPGKGTRGVDYFERWSNKDTIVEWMEIGKLECTFVWFFSPDPSFTQEYLEYTLGAVALPEFVQRAFKPDVGHDELVDLLYTIGFMATQPSDEILSLFDKSLKDPRPNIRLAALSAYMIRRWSQFWDRIVEIQKSDSNAEVRELAGQVLELGPLQ